MQYKHLIESIDNINFKIDESLAPYTSFKIGGKADLLCEVKDEESLVKLVDAALRYGVDYKILGAGSNVLVGDKGYRGLIIINKISSYTFLPYDDADFQLIRLSSGLGLYALTQELFKQGIYGLESFAGIPATIGGAVYMNMHGDGILFSDIIKSVRLLSNNKIEEKNVDYFNFAYDYSILHETKELVLTCDVLLNKGDVSEAKKRYRELLIKKKYQPQRSAGCIFQNLSKEQQDALNLPTPSIAYIIDKILGMKGVEIGGARISNGHAAFIENFADASAKDVLQLINLVREEVKKETNIELNTEIELIGE